MAQLIDKPTRIRSAGNKPKLIDEFIGRVNTGSPAVSIARMQSPAGWVEPGQTPEFDEYTLVLKGELQVETRGEVLQVAAGQALVVPRGEWVRYSTPGKEGAEYVAVCLPAFSPQTVHRDAPDRMNTPTNGDAFPVFGVSENAPAFGLQEVKSAEDEA